MPASPSNDPLRIVTAFVSAALSDTVATFDGQFRECCIAIEVSLKQLADENKLHCTGFELTFDPDKKGLLFAATSVEATPPKGFTGFEGIWKTVFMLCAPKSAPGVSDYLRVRRAMIRFNEFPTVQYEPTTHEQKDPIPS